jgi:hypothetical protein
MATPALRSRVLAGYKKLLSRRAIVFKGDTEALYESGVKLRGEFEKNRSEKNVEAIGKCIFFIFGCRRVTPSCS